MRNEAKANQREGHAAKTPTALLVTLCILLLILIVLLVVFVVIPAAKGEAEPQAADAGSFFDPAAQIGNLPGRTQEEIQAELNKIVEEGMFNISIASIILFEDGKSEGAARIENIAANHHNMSVTITLDDGEVLYESKGLAPGQYIEYITLARDLPKGEYNATALFTAYTPDTLQKAGQAAAKITIVVEK